MRKEIEKRAQILFETCCKLGLNSSYLSVLESMYETASNKKNWFQCDIIQTLIKEEINS